MSYFPEFRLVIVLSSHFLLFVLLTASTFSNWDEIILVADEWCPYNCTPGENKQGYIVEIAKHALESEGHKVV